MACELGKYCELHEFIHGQEAEELRRRIEKLADSIEDNHGDDLVDGDLIVMDLRQILHDVDARDSVAYLEGDKPMKTVTKVEITADGKLKTEGEEA